MRLRMGEDDRISEKVVVAVLVAAMAIGLVLYSMVAPSGSDDEASAAPANVGSTPTTGAPAGASVTTPAPSLTGGGSFGSGVAALDAGATADDLAGSGIATPLVPPTPTPGPVPAPTPACPTSAASDAYESVSDPLAAALGEQLPRDNLRLLAEIAAGCSNATPTTPLLGLALDIARLVPSTGLAPVDLSGIPPVPAPGLPDEVIAALAPLQPTIMEACGNVGLMGVILAVVPSTAGIPVNGSELADLIVPATSLCAQFEG